MPVMTDPMPIMTGPMPIMTDPYPILALFKNYDKQFVALVQAQCLL